MSPFCFKGKEESRSVKDLGSLWYMHNYYKIHVLLYLFKSYFKDFLSWDKAVLHPICWRTSSTTVGEDGEDTGYSGGVGD